MTQDYNNAFTSRVKNAATLNVPISLGRDVSSWLANVPIVNGQPKVLIVVGAPSCSGKAGFKDAVLRLMKSMYPNGQVAEISSERRVKRDKTKYSNEEERLNAKIIANQEKMEEQLSAAKDAISRGCSILYDGRISGGDVTEGIKRVARITEEASKSGYTTLLISPYITIENFIKRIQQRCALDGKALDLANRLSGHKSFSMGWDNLVGMFNMAALFDNNLEPTKNAVLHKPDIIFTKTLNGDNKSINTNSYGEFLAKGAINVDARIDAVPLQYPRVRNNPGMLAI